MELVRLRPNVQVLDIEDSGVLVDMDTGRYLALNGTGYEIAAALGETMTRAALIDRIREKFDANRAEIESDLADFEVILAGLGLTEPGTDFPE